MSKAAIIGGGVIGGGWAARFLLQGWDISVFDPGPQAAQQIDEVLENARASAPLLADSALPAEGRLEICETVHDAVAGANWIQESIPEELALKHKVIAEIEAHAEADVIIGSSTSGFKPSELQDGARHPQRIIVAHPFNPVYLLPLVEVVGGDAAHADTIAKASDVLLSLGMKPLVVRKEIDAHIADRFLEAVWREALWLVRDDIATTAEIDDAIRFGFGLRWAQMGLFETYRLAGGEQGMAHFIAQFGPALQWPWTRLMDVPELTDELIGKIASQSDAQSGKYSHRELERIRDRNLVGIMRSLKEGNWGAGAVLNDHDELLASVNDSTRQSDTSAPLLLYETTVLPLWIDYNGHMTDFRYGEVFSMAADRFLEHIGLDDTYLATGHSIYTVENHIRYLDEASSHERLRCTGQLLFADSKRQHVFFNLYAGDDRLIATAETMFIHVNSESGRACDALPAVADTVEAILELHKDLPRPDAAGRYVGQRAG